MGSYVGKNASVKIGTNTVALMGTWTISGIQADLLEKSAFGDTWKQFDMGLLDGGSISFGGLYDATDTNGQSQLRTYNLNGTEVTTLRLYINATSYWTPKTVSPASHVLITSWEISADKSGHLTATFQGKVSGALELI